jgi:hypothetical protein
MRPLYDARVFDLGHGDLVQVECLACGHVQTLTGAMLRTAGLPDYQPILDLKRRRRCRECDEKGRVDVSIKWAGGA